VLTEANVALLQSCSDVSHINLNQIPSLTEKKLPLRLTFNCVI